MTEVLNFLIDFAEFLALFLSELLELEDLLGCVLEDVELHVLPKRFGDEVYLRKHLHLYESARPESQISLTFSSETACSYLSLLSLSASSFSCFFLFFWSLCFLISSSSESFFLSPAISSRLQLAVQPLDNKHLRQIQQRMTPSMKCRLGAVLLSIMVLHCSCWQFNNRFEEPFENPSQSQFWFDQMVDHNDYSSTEKWRQRYFVYDEHFEPSTGPVILYISGEGECRGVSNTSFSAEIAKQTKGVVVSLQHRFYGESLPFGNETFTLQKLKFLNAGQALNDLAYFIRALQSSSRHRIGAENKWITVGGSYAGALSAWFRSKFPHLTAGAISSSGVVLAVENFRAFDEQIYNSAMKSGEECVEAIRRVTQYAEDQVLSENRVAFQSQFGAEKLNAREFLFYWTDAIVMFIQYGKRSSFCASISNKTLEEAFGVVREAVKGHDYTEYGSFYLRNASWIYEARKNTRPWYYQSCTEFSYFQSFSREHPMRSKMLTIDFFRAWCEDIFGPGTWPAIDRVNNELAGLSIVASNLIMTNGNEDPWRWASLQKSTKTITARVIEGTDIGHCSDLRGSQKGDAKDLTAVRALEMSLVKKWLAE